MAIRAGVHPVLEALRARHPLDRVLIARGAAGSRLQEIIDLCRELSIPVRFEPRSALDRVAGTAAHQGVVALGASGRTADFESLLEGARLVVVCDGVEDPHNLGAIVRTAHAAGANALVIPERRAVGLTEVVAKAAAGALEHLPLARVANISRTLESLKKRGFWIYGLDERGPQDYDRVEFSLPTAIVLGGEGRGLHEMVKRHCDVLVRIPLAGRISSLNVSVAAGIVLFEWKRRYSIV
jgi:23S rRNA (guanosine2251-2'-O)-methyltransferase